MSDRADPEVAAIAAGRLRTIAATLGKARGDGAEADWRRATAALLLDREMLAQALQRQAKPPEVPPGMPIGSADAGGWLDS
jgi:hypothetical protein